MLLNGCRKYVSNTPPPLAPTPVAVAPASAPSIESSPPKKKSRRAARSKRVTPSAVVPPAAPGPTLSEYLSPEQRAEYTRQLDASLVSVQRSLDLLRTRSADPQITRALSRVDAFVQQAHEARNANDLAAARRYAERADALARDLLGQ